jgi:hypothetical protein
MDTKIVNINDIKNDQNIIIKLEQDFDQLKTVNINIGSEGTYQTNCSDYGVLVGKIMLNGGYGVQNAKISVFIPISEDDKSNNEILELYPFETINDTRVSMENRVSLNNEKQY